MFKVISILLAVTILITPLLAIDYTLANGDKLEVRVLGQAQLDTTQTIAPDGSVSLPIMGRTQASGQTLKTFQEKVKKEFAKFAPKSNVVVLLTPRLIAVEEPAPIYVVIHNLKTNTFETKTAKTVTEAKAIAGNYTGEIRPVDIIKIDTGRAPDFWEDNWFKVLSGLAVATGIYNSLK